LDVDCEMGTLEKDRAGPSKKSLAQEIIWPLNNYEKAKEMAKRGKRNVVEKFGADAMVEGILRIYQKICSAVRG
jgi:glycosyltransferase involved in cell wall biosynthesis